MKNRYRNCIFICILLVVKTSFACDERSFVETFTEQGYVEVCNLQFTKKDYKELYIAYESFIQAFQNNPKLKKFIEQTNKNFKSSQLSSYYANAPIGYLYPQNHGKENKNLYHFSKEYYEYLLSNYSANLKEFAVLDKLLFKIKLVNDYVTPLFADLIAELDKEAPGLSEIMYKSRKELTIITKIVQYNYFAESLASHPHYDFSGLTLILDNSDVNDDKLLVSANKNKLQLSDFKKAKRLYNNSFEHSSCLFFPGLALNLEKLNVTPTPHMVKPVEGTRFAIMSFAMVPYKHIDYRQIQVKLDSLVNQEGI